MKKMIADVGVVLLLLFAQCVFAVGGQFFTVGATGAPSAINITLCLNAKGPLSCQQYTVSALTLRISTTIPNHFYPEAGIIINTPGYKIANLGIACTIYKNGYCLFSVSDQQAVSITLNSDNKATQRIQFTSTAPARVDINGSTYTPTATATSGLPVSITVDRSNGVCAISNNGVVSFQAAGTCILDANQAGNTNYNPAAQVQQFITVENAISAIVTPSSLSVDQGQAATFTATATGGAAPYSYQWYSCSTSACTSATLITGAISNTYSPSTAAVGTYYYQAIITDAITATATSNVATLTVDNALSAIVTPSSLNVDAGQVATFTTNPIGGTTPYSYQWYTCATSACTSATLITGAMSNTYSPSTTAAGTFYYQAVVTDASSATATTSVATLTVNNVLSATVTPSSLSVNTGQGATFTSNPMGGAAPYVYQWYSCTTSACTSATLIAGAINNTYSPSTVTAGSYYYEAIVTDADALSATTNVATLTVS